jgi:hypothetical protein
LTSRGMKDDSQNDRVSIDGTYQGSDNDGFKSETPFRE